MNKVFSKLLWGILTGVFAFLLIAVIVGTYIAMTFGSAAINMFFNTSNVERVDDPDAEPSVFFTSDYDEVNAETLLEEDRKIIEEVEGEGATLLWNKQGALPLSGGENVSLLSHSSVDLVETGSGSGWIDSVSKTTNTSHAATLKDAMTDRGFSVNQTLWNFYASGAGSRYTRTDPRSSCTEGQKWTVNEVPWSVYTDAVKNSFASYGDVAIVVLSRSGGEYSDLHYSSTEDPDGNYLNLTDEEKELLTNVQTYKNNNTFKKVVLLINTANALQFADINQYYDAIDACLWIGQVGTFGANAVADILAGNINPSGHLPDTFAYDNESAPATENDGSYMYAGDCSGLNEQGNGIYRQRMYMVYQEGIYVGYKYYETRYEDYVLNNGRNAASSAGAKMGSTWNYANEVAVPFGYGGSYTTFAYDDFKVKEEKDSYTVTVKVSNTGSVPGKDVVQVYLQKPYTDYDQSNGIEKSSVELVGYAKTKLLETSGAESSETVTIEIPKESLKTYDANNAMTYILEKGTYYLTVASDSHTAINNILSKKGYTPEATKVMGATAEAGLGADFAYSFDIANNDFETYSTSTQTGYEITNQFDSGDWNKYENNGGTYVTYLSRSDWQGTYPSTPTLTMTDGLKADLAYDREPVENPEQEAPVYGQVRGEGGMASIEAGDAVAFQFIEAPLWPEKEKDNQTVYPYENEDGSIEQLQYSEYWERMWNKLLDQMTFEEQALMCANAYHQLNGASSIALDSSKQENGPVGFTKRSDFPVPNDVDEYHWVAYPCAPIVAATWNNELIERMGKHKGEDGMYLGYNGIYGPGVNMHRSPFGGRNFEYPSEDSFLAGTIEYYESKGIESKGVMAYAKHYALNDMETNRRHCGIWSNEQATREIYLYAFELTFAEGGASATMNSFTRVGARWCGASYAMMTTVLRDEWGFDGIVISDWDSGGSMSKVDGILAGTDSFDGNGNAHSYDKWKDSVAVQNALREATKHIIYNVVRTNVMNGTSVTTTYRSITPWWQTALYGIDIGVGVIFVGCATMLVLSFVLKRQTPDAGDGMMTY